MIGISELLAEARLIYAERRDSVQAQAVALERNPKAAKFTAEEIQKRRARLPKVEGIGRGLAAIEARRAEVPDWILTAFEGERA